MEKLSLVLPDRPPYFPRQFDRCAVIGNSGDLLKTKFGKEIDSYDVVIRENGAPIQVKLIFMSAFLAVFFFPLTLQIFFTLFYDFHFMNFLYLVLVCFMAELYRVRG